MNFLEKAGILLFIAGVSIFTSNQTIYSIPTGIAMLIFGGFLFLIDEKNGKESENEDAKN